MLNIKLYGAKQYWCQVPRISQGFGGLGHNTGKSDKYDLVYANNFPYSEIDSEHNDSALDNECFKIFNVLDIPAHVPDFPLEKLKKELSQASMVTCISEPVKHQLSTMLNIQAHIIDNPIKDVFFDSAVKRDIDCLYVGRGTDPVKRSHLLEPLFANMVSVGPFSGFGKHLGLVADLALNQLYNRAKVVPLSSSFEGLGLTVLEAMVCGAVPLVCSDNPNSQLCPSFCICAPTQEAILSKYHEILDNFTDYSQHILSQYSSQIQYRFSKFRIAQNILDLYTIYSRQSTGCSVI